MGQGSNLVSLGFEICVPNPRPPQRTRRAGVDVEAGNLILGVLNSRSSESFGRLQTTPRDRIEKPALTLRRAGGTGGT